MVQRVCLPGEFFLDAIVVNPLRVLYGQKADIDRLKWIDRLNWAQPDNIDKKTVARARRRGTYIALRWVLNAALGIPLKPFTVWRRAAVLRPPAKAIAHWHATGADTFWWDGVTEILRIELDVSGPVTAWGLSRFDQDPVASVSGGPGTIELQGGPMLGVRLSDPSALTAHRGLSTLDMANSGGWIAIERVGLPLPPSLEGASYYKPRPQGPIATPTDPITAAIERLKRWGPIVGWQPLVGLPPWVSPDPKRLVEEFDADLVPDLVAVLAANPPPNLGAQVTAERPPKPLSALRQWAGCSPYSFGGGSAVQRSEIITRPLQSVTAAVASDTWSSLVLGFGTGASIGDSGGTDDFMVTAPWQGFMKAAVPNRWPWPWNAPQPEIITKEVKRELAAVVLSPQLRSAPDTPVPVLPAATYVEGAPKPNQPFTSGVKIETPRSKLLPSQSHASGYGIARFDKPLVGQYRLRKRTKSGGWVPVGAAQPVRAPEDPPDPALTPGMVMLRDSGVERPITGAPRQYQYAIAATDLFGQWSPWSTGWLSLGPSDVQIPKVTFTRARAKTGPGDADPCQLDVTAEINWDASERTCRHMRLVVDVFDPYPVPPAALAAPYDAPKPGWTAKDVIAEFDTAGMPITVPAGLTVTPLHADDTPVTTASPFIGTDRRYRFEWPAIAVVYGTAKEKAAVIYAQAEEHVRPGEWSGWGHAREMVIAPSPLPPPTPVPLPPEYPEWASLPDAAGVSVASVEWAPTGAWRYRVFEATEAALLAACGQPGPALTTGYGARMQALFDLHKYPTNLAALKAAYRKLGTEPIKPAMQPNGKMRYEAVLPRGSSLIHCFIVVGVTETNVISGWPVPDADGRKSFLAYAIPRPIRPPVPEIAAQIGDAGTPEIVVTVGGAIPVTSVRLYRASKPVLARNVSTMELIATVAPPPGSWQTTTFQDLTVTPGWERRQYRAVANYDDDQDLAHIAVDSPPSRAYSLLYPPPEPPLLSLSEIVAKRTTTMAIVKVTTDAPDFGTAIGDHLLSWIVRQDGQDPHQDSSTIAGLDAFANLDALIASAERAGRVGSDLYLRLDRTGGVALTLSVDVTDPLGRSAHQVLDIPVYVPDPTPVITTFMVVRHTALNDRAVWIGIDSNTHDPAPGWTLAIRYRRAAGFLLPVTIRTFDIDSIVSVPNAAAVPKPVQTADQWIIRRIGTSGRFVMWVRSTVALQVSATLTNSTGQSAISQATST